MAVTLEIGVCDLLTELLANALILFGTLQTAGAIATGALQAFFYGFDHFCIFIESDCHKEISFFFSLYMECQVLRDMILSSFLFSLSML
jgi:hypothetical protein